MSLQHGLDPQKIMAIAQHLTSQGDNLEHVQRSGTTMMMVLADSWAGPDIDVFHSSWQHAVPQIEAMSASLRAAAKTLHQQAQDQVHASGESATGGTSGTTGHGGRPGISRDGHPWDGTTDFGKGLLLPSTGVIDTAKKIADHTADGIREGADRVNDGIQEGVDRVNDGINEGIDRVNKGMDWLEDRADQARDWGQDKAERLAGAALGAAVSPLLTGVAITNTVNRELAEALGLINQHGEAGVPTHLSPDQTVDGHPKVREPTSLEEIMRGTTDAYATDGTVRVTEITRSDGTSTYIVNIPGTQFGSDLPGNPLDAAGNVPTVGGNSSAATEAVWDAMENAGIPPGSPVLTVGHSQGGMIAQTLLSDPAFTERFNVTHSMTYGSPVDAIPDTSGARQLHLRHESDIVPRLDLGNGPLPSSLQDDSTVVPLDNPPGVQPFVPSTPNNPVPILDIAEAHSEKKYADSVGSSNDPRVTAFEDGLDDFIVQSGDDSKVSAVDVEIRRKK